jgi:hypothetical protein
MVMCFIDIEKALEAWSRYRNTEKLPCKVKATATKTLALLQNHEKIFFENFATISIIDFRF